MYEAAADPYCYPGTTVLRNIPGLTSQADLERFEIVATARRFLEPMPAGRWTASHYCALHHHIFQDVFPWAGRIRTVRIGKGGHMFCYPEYIRAELRRVFNWLRTAEAVRDPDPGSFANKAAHLLAELNAIHAFRDGNGRTQLAFTALLAAKAGHPLALEHLEPEGFLQAMIASFAGDEIPLARQVRALLKPSLSHA